MALNGRFLFMALAFIGFPSIGEAGDDLACAKYDEPLAYNACLASHGPKANIGGAYSDGAAPRAPATARMAAAPAAHRGWPRETRRRGRVHMEFEVK
jgi:hypothetical protein